MCEDKPKQNNMEVQCMITENSDQSQDNQYKSESGDKNIYLQIPQEDDLRRCNSSASYKSTQASEMSSNSFQLGPNKSRMMSPQVMPKTKGHTARLAPFSRRQECYEASYDSQSIINLTIKPDLYPCELVKPKYFNFEESENSQMGMSKQDNEDVFTPEFRDMNKRKTLGQNIAYLNRQIETEEQIYRIIRNRLEAHKKLNKKVQLHQSQYKQEVPMVTINLSLKKNKKRNKSQVNKMADKQQKKMKNRSKSYAQKSGKIGVREIVNDNLYKYNGMILYKKTIQSKDKNQQLDYYYTN